MVMLVHGPRVVDYFNSGCCGWIFQAAESLLWVQCFYFGIIYLVVLKYSEILTHNALFSGLQVKFYQVTCKHSTEVFVLSSSQTTLFNYKEILHLLCTN